MSTRRAMLLARPVARLTAHALAEVLVPFHVACRLRVALAALLMHGGRLKQHQK